MSGLDNHPPRDWKRVAADAWQCGNCKLYVVTDTRVAGHRGGRCGIPDVGHVTRDGTQYIVHVDETARTFSTLSRGENVGEGHTSPTFKFSEYREWMGLPS